MRARFAAGVLVGALVAFGATGCAFIAPQATLDEVETSNGVNGDTGSIAVRNATLLSNNDGSTSTLLASFINQGQRDQQVSIQWKTAKGDQLTENVYVASGQTVSVGGAGERAIKVDAVDAPAGSLFSMFFQTGSAPGKQLLVPVLTSDWQEYDGLGPTPAPVTVIVPTGKPATPQLATPTPTPSAH